MPLPPNASAGDWIKDFINSDNPKFAGKSKKERQKMALAAYYARHQNESVEQIDELSNKIYKSYSKKSSRDADKHINRFLKGGNEKSITHAEKRSKGINSAQQLMARKKMKIEEVEPLEELKADTHLSAAAKRVKQALDQKNSPEASRGEKDKKGRSAMDYFEKADKHVDAYVKKPHKEEVTMEYNEEAEQIDELSDNTKKRYADTVSRLGVAYLVKTKGVQKAGKHLGNAFKIHSKEETEMEYNEADGHIALVNAIFDGNRDEANEIFDTVLSGRINPVVSAKKEELAKTMFTAHEEVTEEYDPLPLTEEAEHGHHHRVHASLTDRKNDLSNEAHNAFMSGNVTKEHKKEVLKHVKSAEGRLDLAKDKLGSAESADHLNAAAVHITDGGLHLQNVRTYTSLGFRGY